MKKKKVIWTKWVDPMNSNIDEVEFPGFDDVNENDIKAIEYYDFSENKQAVAEQDIDFDGLTNKIHSIKPVRVINTRLGLLTVTEHTLAANQFDFWNLHTNFDISENVVNTIKKSEGVESLMIISRYRARIGFPRVDTFNITDCKFAIEKDLCKDEQDDEENNYRLEDIGLFSDEVQERVSSLLSDIAKNKYWVVYVAPNGYIDSVASSSKNEVFLHKKSLFERTYASVGGYLHSV